MNQLLKVESATDGDRFVGYRLKIAGKIYIVFADQEGMPGVRTCEDLEGFVNPIDSTITYNTVFNSSAKEEIQRMT